jgi:hypothetical protein
MRVRRFITAVFIAAALGPAAAQDLALVGTYTQNQPCKGGGRDPANKIVTIGETGITSNFGPCTFVSKEPAGNVLKAQASCKKAGGAEFDVDLVFTIKDDKTVEFVEESSDYKSVLYRCPAGAAAAPAPAK